VRISYECDQHPKYKADGRGYKHQIEVPTRDSAAVVAACKELLNRLEGTPSQRKEKPKPKISTSLEELSDEQLEALVSGGTDGEIDGGAA
jgi:hypothetical protein